MTNPTTPTPTPMVKSPEKPTAQSSEVKKSGPKSSIERSKVPGNER